MRNMNMKETLRRFVTAGIIASMMITPAASFADTTDEVPEAPEAPVAESYEDNALIEDYNRKVDEYNASAEAYNKAVDEEYDAAVEETNKKNEEIAAHNEAEQKRVAEAKERNEKAVQDADERNRQIDEENAAGRKAAEEARDAKYESDVSRYNEDLEKYEADTKQYEYDLAMEQKIKNAGYQSVEHYNNTINSYYNEPAKKSVEKNASAAKLGASDTYTVQEAEEKSGRMIKVTVKHNFYGTDITYTEEFEIDANDVITFRPLSARAETTNPRYAAFYYNTDDAHSMGYWMESDSYVGTNARYHNSGWECGDTHEISFKDGKKRASDIEDIEVEYNYTWMALKTYKTYNVPTAPDAPEAPVKGDVDFEDAPYVEAELEDIVDADILDFIESPVRKAYLDMLSHMDLFEVPEIPAADPVIPETPETPDGTEPEETAPFADPETPAGTKADKAEADRAETDEKEDAEENSAAPFAALMTANTNSNIGTEDAPEAAAEGVQTEDITDGSVARANGEGAWALMNLIAAIVTVLIAAIAVILGLKKKEEDEDEEREEDRTNRKIFVRGLSVIAAITSAIVFMLTEDMTLPMQMTDSWTLIMAVILAVEAVFAVASKKTVREGEEKQEDDAFEAELA